MPTTLKEMGWGGFAASMWERARRTCVPLTGTFELTPLCNFRCRMCYMRLDASEVPRHGRLHTADEWIDLARQAMELGTYRITLTGGEVLTRPDFPKIYTNLIQMGLLVSVLSNASLITEETVHMFQQYRPSKLRFTLYGASNETYERLCGAPDGFDRVMKSLHRLKEHDIPFSLAFTETTENVDDFDAVLDIAEQLGVSIAVTCNIVPAVRGATSEGSALRVDIANRPTTDRPLDNVREDYLASFFKTRDARDPELFSGLFATCKAYRTSFVVEWNGEMEVCTYMGSSNVRPFEEGFKAAWEHLNEHLESLEFPETCRSCPAIALCATCPGIREAITGRPDGIPRELCEQARVQYASMVSERQ